MGHCWGAYVFKLTDMHRSLGRHVVHALEKPQQRTWEHAPHRSEAHPLAGP